MPSDDFDIHEFARLLDAALTSDNPSVKKALRNFMLITTIAEAEATSEDNTKGPFAALFKQYEALNERIVSLELNMAVAKSKHTDFNKYYTTTTPYTINKWNIPPTVSSTKETIEEDLMKRYSYGIDSASIINSSFKGIFDSDAT